MVDEIYEYIPNLHGNHTLCYFMNDCRIILKRKNPSEGTEWCQILQKARTANPSATTMLAVAQWQISCLWKDLNTRKQHVENISQMYVKNSWREAHYHATCRRDYTREDDRNQETIKDTKTIDEQASNKTIFKHYFQYIIISMLWAESFRDTEITTLRKNYETGTFHASSL